MNHDNILTQALRDSFDALEFLAFNHLMASPALAPGGTATNFAVGAFSYMLGGVAYNKAAADNIAAPGSSTSSGEYRKILITIDAAGTVATVAGDVAASQAAAVIPDTPADKLAIGVLELPPSFTSGATDVTSGMCKSVTHAVNVIES